MYSVQNKKKKNKEMPNKQKNFLAQNWLINFLFLPISKHTRTASQRIIPYSFSVCNSMNSLIQIVIKSIREIR